MRNRILVVITVPLVAGMLAACSGGSGNTETSAVSEVPSSNEADRVSRTRSGVVEETMDAAGYTYVMVDTGTESFWAAAPTFAVDVGDAVVVPAGMPMQDFHSSALDRDFDVVYFVESIQVGGEEVAATSDLPAGHPPVAASPAVTKAGEIEPLEGGRSVAEIIAARADLDGSTVSFRGEVVKFNANIMGSNWLHVQDGTGEPGRNDLTVTTSDVARVGDIVTVTGVLAKDKDFGAGYEYDVIVEEARVTVE